MRRDLGALCCIGSNFSVEGCPARPDIVPVVGYEILSGSARAQTPRRRPPRTWTAAPLADQPAQLIKLERMTDRRPFAVLFDLDGTLIDSIGLLLASVKHTFTGRSPAPTEEEWIAGIGTPLAKQLRPFAASDGEAAKLQLAYRTFQREHHDRMTTAFEGVPETLAELDKRGHPMGLVTSKSNEMMQRAIEFVGLARYMKTMIGADSCTTHKPDAFPVLLALQQLGYNTDEAVFVGDSPHDVHAGNAAKVVSIAALWGPFTREQLAPASPAHYLDSIRDLPDLLDSIQIGAGRNDPASDDRGPTTDT